MADVTIVVPAYNEEKRISAMLDALLEHFGGQQVIVVSDGSTDSTASIVRGYPTVELIEAATTSGKGSAIVKGLKRSSGNIIGFLDADGSFDPKEVKKLIEAFDEDTGCVIASKWMGRSFSEVGEDAFRKVAGRIWNSLVNIFLGLSLKDTQAGAKFLKRDVFEKIDCDFISSGFEFDVELLYRVKKAGYSIREVYVPYNVISNSTFRYSKTPSMLWDLLRIAIFAR